MSIEKQTEFKSAYDAGYDCGLNGVNNSNSHFKWFATKESMQEWSRGKKKAETEGRKLAAICNGK